ncbi:MAG: hypothetical protein U0K68_02505 [Agathobacter sp.]|nr:hypothetical protein [Agathobacter sp.]
MKNKIVVLATMLIFGTSLYITGCGKAADTSANNSKAENSAEGKSEEGKEEGAGTEVSLKDNDIYFVKINGKELKAGDKLSDVEGAGLKQKESNLEQEIPVNRYLLAQFVLDANDNEVCKFTPLNSTDSKISVKDAVIGGFEVGDVCYKNISEATLALDLEVAGGIKLGSSYEDMVKVFGKEYNETKFDADEKYEIPAHVAYTYSAGFKSYSFTIDDSDRITKIEWNDFDFDE